MRRAESGAAHILILSALSAFTLTGCAVGPDFERPRTPAGAAYTPAPLPEKTAASDTPGGEAQRFVAGMDIPRQWWELFHSGRLNALIERALKANPDLQAAQAALSVAKENLAAQEGAYFPSVSANFTPTRQKNAVQPSPTLNTYVPYFNLYTAQVSVSYVPDVFGGTRRSVENLEAQMEGQRFETEATYLTLTSNLVAAAIQEASLRAQIAATQEIIRIDTEARDLLRRQLALGQVAGADVAAQEAALAQAQANLPPLQKQLAQQRNLLTALLGGLPNEEPAEKFDLAALQLPRDLPLSLPSRLVEQRPDLRAAEANLHAASAQIGVAIANRLPQIVLSATDGTVATHLGQLFQPGNGFWDLSASLTQPLFDGFALMHKQRAAEAAFEQAAAQYRSTVVTSFRNVADTLQALLSDAEALKADLAAERAAAESLEIARKQLQLGAVSYLALLTAEQTYQQAVIALVQARAGRYADTAALFQALGGGWWNDQDPASASSPIEQSLSKTES